MVGASGNAERAVRSATEQWTSARAFPRGQHDLPREGHSGKDTGHFRRDFAGARSRARRPERHLALAHFAVWTASRARVGDGPCQRTRTLHADELHREPGKQTDQQPYRSGDSHASLQGNERSHADFGGDWRKSLAARKPSLRPSHTAERRRDRAEMEAPRLSLSRK